MQIPADYKLDHGDTAVTQGHNGGDDVFPLIRAGTNRLVRDEWMHLCSGGLLHSFAMKGMMKRKRTALLLD